MPIGMQVWDENGNLLIDVTTRLSRLIGSVVIPAGSTSSIAVPNSTEGLVWYAIYTTNGNRYSPVITVTNGANASIAWAPRTAFPGGPVDATMLYGLY